MIINCGMSFSKLGRQDDPEHRIITVKSVFLPAVFWLWGFLFIPGHHSICELCDVKWGSLGCSLCFNSIPKAFSRVTVKGFVQNSRFLSNAPSANYVFMEHGTHCHAGNRYGPSGSSQRKLYKDIQYNCMLATEIHIWVWRSGVYRHLAISEQKDVGDFYHVVGCPNLCTCRKCCFLIRYLDSWAKETRSLFF